jgi:hypothetical protein
MFVGALFTQTYAKATGSRIVPTPNAVPVTAEARAEQGMPRKEQLRAPAGAGGDANTPSLDPARLGTPAVASARIQSPREKLEQALAEQSWKSIPRTREIIRRNPWPYLGLALGFGLATGSIVKRDFAHRAHVS